MSEARNYCGKKSGHLFEKFSVAALSACFAGFLMLVPAYPDEPVALVTQAASSSKESPRQVTLGTNAPENTTEKRAASSDPARERQRSPDPALQALVDEDWRRQEAWRGRQFNSPQAIEAVVQRAERMLQEVEHNLPPRVAQERLSKVASWRKLLPHLPQAPELFRTELYRQIRSTVREWVLNDAQIASQPILFLKCRRFICQMLHEYVGHYYNVADLAGGGVYVLVSPGRSLEVKELTRGKLPRGAFQTLALDYDAKTAFFAFAPVSSAPRDRAVVPNWQMLTAKPLPPHYDYFSPQRSSFNLFELNLEDGAVRQLTTGIEDDTAPCPLPDGGLVFMSSRRGGFCRCNNWWEPLPTYTLHKLDRKTGRITTISFHETNEWHPTVLNDGRICYCRWDYVDRSAAHFHGLWTCLPDGSGARAWFGNYTMEISACFQPRAIPGSRKIAFIAGAHHAVVGGSLVLLDPDRIRLDPASGEDQFDCLEVLTPEIEFPETPDEWPTGYFVSPWPLSEDRFLVAFGFDRLPGLVSGNAFEEGTGLYYFDRWGNLELLYRASKISSLDPIPLVPRPAPPVIPVAEREHDAALVTPGTEGAYPAEAEVFVYDVRQSLMPLPEGRAIRELRIFQLFPKSTPTVNQPRLGHANADNARALIGTVPVEEDGSAYFRVPANRPLYFQIVDAEGRAVQGMRSVAYFLPGERTGCVGCHEPLHRAPPERAPLALRRAASVPMPGPDGTKPFSFVRLIQPILQRRCVRCHAPPEYWISSLSRTKLSEEIEQVMTPVASGMARSPAKPYLTSEPVGKFTRAYGNLREYVAFFEWGGATIDPIVTKPGRLGADMSPLSRILEDDLHRAECGLTDEERRTILLWLDANVPFYGTYDEELQMAQLRGEKIDLPKIQ